MPVSIVTDSVASLPREDLERYGIGVVSLYVSDGETTVADVDLDPEAFYRRLGDMAHLPTSSQPSVESLLDAFRTPVERGHDVVGVFISERMSGTLETARMAAEMVRAEHPGAVIELVDSHSNSMEEGMAVEAAARAAQAGESAERCAAAAVENRAHTRYLFTPETLEYLRRGGRIGAASALVGGLLQIKPILTVNDEGVTDVWARVRTRQRALSELAAQLASDAATYGLAEVVVHYIGERGPAEAFAREHVEPISGVAPRVIPVSPVIGVHVGPALGIVYRTEREMRG
jgi:DegV family protein with EDD domain